MFKMSRGNIKFRICAIVVCNLMFALFLLGAFFRGETCVFLYLPQIILVDFLTYFIFKNLIEPVD